MKKRIIAHLRKKDHEPQFLWDHLRGVSSLAGQFAEKVGLKETGEVLGLLHDLGKASKEFQNYICSAVGLIDPDQDEYVDVISKKGKVDHSSAGAQLIYNSLYNKGPEKLIVAQILSLCIASHHSGLIDCLSPDGVNAFQKRIEKPEDFTHSYEALSRFTPREKQSINEILNNETVVTQLIQKLKMVKEEEDYQDTVLFKYGLLIRFLFSCLIDADRLDTADFETPGKIQLRNYGQYHPWEILIHRLDMKLKEFEEKLSKNDVDVLREQVSQSCYSFSTRPKGVYQIKVPTGGGKTLASLRFALNHAAFHQMDRIFYIIPFTSIIDQNADEVRKILEDRDDAGQYLDKVVLEHHSNLTPEEETRRQCLLAENWDAPVVFTTQVQFLESLFVSGTKSARRMHQLANSVIIFDEVQTIPIRCVHLFNLALRFLVHSCGSTVVLCTATQPLLDKVDPIHRALTIQPDHKMILDEGELFRKLKRVQAFDRRKIGGWSDEDVSELVEHEIRAKGSVLIIVNTKKSARSLYQAIADKNIADVYHLSTNMCPAHRLNALRNVKEKLSSEKPVVCVSTQLIEAGVDISFGSVIRYQAGLDSIVQAAGRCNRNGKSELGNVWIVNPAEENLDKLNDVRIGKENAERVLNEFRNNPDEFENDLLGLIAVERYYEYYFYARKDEMRYKVGKQSSVGREDDLFNLLSTNVIAVAEHQRISNSAPPIPFKQSFQAAAKSFYAIDSPALGVVVPYGKEGEEIINDLCCAYELDKQYQLLKKAQRFSVNLLPDELKSMSRKKAIREVQKESGIFFLDEQYYSDQFGWCNEFVNNMKLAVF